MKKYLIAVISIFLCFNIFAVEVNKSELENSQTQVIEFQNYNGAHKVIESVNSIKGIGSTLANQVISSNNDNFSFTLNGKYKIIHIFDENSEKLCADILILTENAGVDHIKNLRRIITAYLETNYGYDEKDASTLATFITVYNAVYRNDLDFFTSKYNDEVVSNLTKEKCGLSTNWSEWAGNTQILIPLSGLRNSISTIETSEISDKTVIQAIKENDDRGVDERKNMVDLKERESDIAQDKANDSAKNLQEESAKLEELEADSAEKDKVLEEKQKDLQEAEEKLAKDPKNKALQKEVEEKSKAVEKAKVESEAAKQKVSEQKKKVDEAQAQLKKEQQFADKKNSEAKTERTNIAQDQKAVIQENIENSNADNYIFGLTIIDAAKNQCGLVKMNCNTGKIIKTSPINQIRGKAVYKVSNPQIEKEKEAEVDTSTMFIAICGENTENHACKLVLIDAASMEIQKESEVAISENSVLVNDKDNFYCIIQNGSTFTLGVFDKSLNIVQVSPEKLKDGTPIVLTDKGIIVTSSNGKAIVLNTKDLSIIK